MATVNPIKSIHIEEEWNTWAAKPGLKVLDVYSKWSGPCDAIQSIFKRIKLDLGEQINFLQVFHFFYMKVQTDTIEAFAKYRNRSRPTFLFYYGDTLVKIVSGTNSPLIEKTIKDQIKLEKSGGLHVPLTDVAFIADLKKTPAPAEGTHIELPKLPTSDMPLTSNAVVDSVNVEHTLAFIKPDAMHPSIISQILDVLKRNRIDVIGRKKVWINRAQAGELYKEHKTADWFGRLVTFLSSAPILVLLLAKEDAVTVWRDLIGPTSTKRAKDEKPKCIRALYGTDNLMNAVFGSVSLESAKSEIDFFFNGEANGSGQIIELDFSELALESAGVTSQKTFVLLKPDICGVQGSGGGEGSSGSSKAVEDIIERILWRGYQIIKREEFLMPVEQASELLSMHRDKPWFQELIAFMASGPSIALVLRGEDVVKGWAEIAGPLDPDAARIQAPMSIRAQYGISMVQNAVYSSDNLEDAMRDIQVMFPHIAMTRQGSQIISRNENASIRGSRTSLVKGSSASDVALEQSKERTLCIIKDNALITAKDLVLQGIVDSGFKIVIQKLISLDDSKAREFLKDQADNSNFTEIVASFTNSPVLALVLEKVGAINSWIELVGPMGHEIAKKNAPDSLRARFGTSDAKNGLHGSESPTAADREISLIFDNSVSSVPEGYQRSLSHAHLISYENEYYSGRKSVALVENVAATKAPASSMAQRTLALIKPDAYAAGKKDEILAIIQNAGFNIIEGKEIHWDLKSARNFYKEHLGKSFYVDLTSWMSSAPIYAMILEKDDAVVSWRKLAGPTDSTKAREIAPTSIRALYGKDGSFNAVHGSDSSESSDREIQAVFGDISAIAAEPRKPDEPPSVQFVSPNKARRTPSQASILGGPAKRTPSTQVLGKATSIQALGKAKSTMSVSSLSKNASMSKSQLIAPKRVQSSQALAESQSVIATKKTASTYSLKEGAAKAKRATSSSKLTEDIKPSTTSSNDAIKSSKLSVKSKTK